MCVYISEVVFNRPLLEGAPLGTVLAVKVEKGVRPCCRRGLYRTGPGEDGTEMRNLIG